MPLSEQTKERLPETGIEIVPLKNVPFGRRGRYAVSAFSELFEVLDKLDYSQAVKFTWPNGMSVPCNSAKDGAKPTLSTWLNYHAKKRGYRVSYTAHDFPTVYAWKRKPAGIEVKTSIVALREAAV